MNPLLDFSGLPRFDAVQPEHVASAIRQLLDENRALIERLIAPETAATWDAFVQPMLDAGERLSRAWGVVGHLHSVNDVPPWREAYNAMLPEVSSFYADLGQNLALFAKYKALAASAGFPGLSPARRRIIENDLRDFRLSGAELAEEQKPRFKEIQEELSALGAKFSENVLDATNAHAEWIAEEAGIKGLPDDVKAAARAAAEKDGEFAKRDGVTESALEVLFCRGRVGAVAVEHDQSRESFLHFACESLGERTLPLLGGPVMVVEMEVAQSACAQRFRRAAHEFFIGVMHRQVFHTSHWRKSNANARRAELRNAQIGDLK